MHVTRHGGGGPEGWGEEFAEDWLVNSPAGWCLESILDLAREINVYVESGGRNSFVGDDAKDFLDDQMPGTSGAMDDADWADFWNGAMSYLGYAFEDAVEMAKEEWDGWPIGGASSGLLFTVSGP